MAMPIFAFTNFSAELMLFSTHVFLGAIIAVFTVYLITRTKYYDFALAVSLAGITYLPIVIFLYGSSWQPADLPRLMVWFLVALIAGTLLSGTRTVIFQSTTMIVLMSVILSFGFGLPFTDYDSHIGTAVVVTVFVAIVSYTLEQYVGEVEQRTDDLNREQRELEMYTQLLRHDLRNDLQAILSSIELAEMLLDVNAEKVREHLALSLVLGNRMVELLHVFSMPLERVETDLVKHIRSVAENAQKAHGNLTIEITQEPGVEEATFTASRLLPMVWQNIFRNVAQYAGESPTVRVHVGREQAGFLISISDDGPGIREDKKQFLFRRGSQSESGERGLGLYLCRFVLDSLGGSIELVDNPDGEQGTRFLIRIPLSPS
jgi:signal transduction histidine kinase